MTSDREVTEGVDTGTLPPGGQLELCWVGGRSLAYLDAGTDQRGTVVALHSLGTDHRIWSDQVRPLTDAGYRLIAPDARGHGASTWAPLEDSRGWVADLDAVLDDAGVDTAFFVGVSMGAAQALEYALSAPDRVAGLVLSGAFGNLPEQEAATKVSGLAGSATEHGMAKWAEIYTEDTLITDDADAREVVRAAISKVPLEAYVRSAEICFQTRSGDLASLTTQTLVLWGERDHKAPLEMSEQLAADLPNATLRRLPGAGHLSPIDRPAAFASAILEFIDQLE